jgi:ABC-2 type transport system ATP-binding protein
LLLLDEPVSGLDPLARQQFRQIIKILQEAGMTILISSHVLSDLAELCTSIGIMELGFLVESTSLPELYQRLSRQQIILGTLGKMEMLQQKLSQNSLVKTWEIVSNNRLKVNFAGNEADCAELLRSLVLADIPVTQFDCNPENLETIFLNLGHQQTS